MYDDSGIFLRSMNLIKTSPSTFLVFRMTLRHHKPLMISIYLKIVLDKQISLITELYFIIYYFLFLFFVSQLTI